MNINIAYIAMFSLSKLVYLVRNRGPLHTFQLVPQFKRNLHQPFMFKVGDKAEISRTFSASDVRKFADLTGDQNPLHVDEEYARRTRFGRCIVHGVLTNGLISAVLATKLPGPGALFLSQEIAFPSPLYINEQVTAIVEIVSITGQRVDCLTTCIAKDTQKVVMSGTVKLFMMKDIRGKP